MTRYEDDCLDLRGHNVLITGVPSPWATQAAQMLAHAGARLMLCAQQADVLESTCMDLQDQGFDARWVAADVCQRPGVDHVIDETLQRMGDVDLLLDSLAWQAGGRLSEQLVGRSMAARRRGHVVYLAGQLEMAQQAGLRALCLRQGTAWAGAHITVHALCPTAISCTMVCAQGAPQDAARGFDARLLEVLGPRGVALSGQVLCVDAASDAGAAGGSNQ